MVEATYLNTGVRSLAVVTVEGRQLGFEMAESASGARYIAVDAMLPCIWWTKGDAASLSYRPVSDEIVIYADCAVRMVP